MKRLLLVSPAVPRPTGSGLQMRAWMFLRGLARQHAVTLVVGSPGFPEARERDLQGVRAYVDDLIVLDFRPTHDPFLLARKIAARLGYLSGPCWDWAEPTAPMRERLARLWPRGFDLVHVFRLYMLPVALASLDPARSPRLQLDLDDWESETRLGLARSMSSREPELARRHDEEGLALARVERDWLPRFERVFVACPADQAALAERYRLANTATVANTIDAPASLPEPPEAEAANLLFVGGLGYWPNRAAVEFLLDSVWPLLAEPSIRLTVVGRGAPPALRERLRRSGCRWLDQAERLEPLYARAHIALAPVRAGGGTRIKALEAFARGRPLVATPAAVAGLDVEAGVHYVAAESAAEWSRAIVDLLADADLRKRLAQAAFAWVRRNHDLARGIDRIAHLCEEP